MISQDKVITTTWAQISNNEDYILRNTGADTILLKASATIPTDMAGTLPVYPKEGVKSDDFSGVIWAKSINSSVTVFFAK